MLFAISNNQHNYSKYLRTKACQIGKYLGAHDVMGAWDKVIKSTQQTYLTYTPTPNLWM